VKTALITGAAGFIGRNFRRYLEGWAITCVDVKTGTDARRFFQRDSKRYDLVLHCAAHVGGRLDIEGKAAYIGAYDVQLDGAMFEWALRTRPAHVVYWSSSAAYPVELQDRASVSSLREDEIDILWPDPADFTYGWAKLVGERLAYEAQQDGLRVHVFRPFSGYGPDQGVEYPFGMFLKRARERADPFTIWGSGEQCRDFIHISDIISATMAAIEQDYIGPMNLCTGVPTSFHTLARLVSAGYRPSIVPDGTKPQGVFYRVGDPTEMHKVWIPHVSIGEGVTAALTSTA
jgi:nucleoside-diphosphate-sugar epimerase